MIMIMLQYSSGYQRYMGQVTPENHGGSSAQGPTVQLTDWGPMPGKRSGTGDLGSVARASRTLDSSWICVCETSGMDTRETMWWLPNTQAFHQEKDKLTNSY